MLGVLAPELQRVIGWNEIEYGNIVTVFQAAYAVALVFGGRFIDRVGPGLEMRSRSRYGASRPSAIPWPAQ